MVTMKKKTRTHGLSCGEMSDIIYTAQQLDRNHVNDDVEPSYQPSSTYRSNRNDTCLSRNISTRLIEGEFYTHIFVLNMLETQCSNNIRNNDIILVDIKVICIN